MNDNVDGSIHKIKIKRKAYPQNPYKSWKKCALREVFRIGSHYLNTILIVRKPFLPSPSSSRAERWNEGNKRTRGKMDTHSSLREYYSSLDSIWKYTKRDMAQSVTDRDWDMAQYQSLGISEAWQHGHTEFVRATLKAAYIK